MALNILIVDDSETVRDIITKTLQLSHVPINQIYNAANGQEALDLLKDNWIDLVFSDINMPVMNGVEMIEKMLEDDLLASIPIIVISTEGSTTRIDQLKEKGVSAYIRKPFTPEGLSEVVQNVVGVSSDDNES